MLGSALHVPDPLATELLLELRRPAPGGVLPPLVGQNLPRSPVRRDPAVERLEHESRALVVRDGVPDDEPRVVVHERREVEPLVAPQQEREDVRLPELVRLCPLEAPLRVLPSGRRFALLEEALLVKDPPDRGLSDSERREPAQHVGDPPRAVLGMLLLQRRDRLASRVRRLRCGRPHERLRDQPVQPALAVAPHPVADGRDREPEDARHVRDRRALVHDLLNDP